MIRSALARALCILVIFYTVTTGSADAQNIDSLLSAKVPANASVFGAGIFSNGFNNRDFTISPDGNKIFFTVQSARFLKSVIVHLTKSHGAWGQPEIAPFSGKYRDLEAFFAPDGTSIYFSSDRPVNEKDTVVDFDIWKVAKENGRWGSPVNLGPQVNSEKDEFYPSVGRSGNIYFTAQPENGFGEEDIVMCRPGKGAYMQREILDSAVNTKGDEFNAFTDPDEKMIIFSSYKGRTDEQGGGDLYISYKDKSGKWIPAVNMGNAVNSHALDYCPFVSFDKKKMFFSSNRNNLSARTPKNYKELLNMLGSYGNSSDDIYWIDFSSFIK